MENPVGRLTLLHGLYGNIQVWEMGQKRVRSQKRVSHKKREYVSVPRLVSPQVTTCLICPKAIRVWDLSVGRGSGPPPSPSRLPAEEGAQGSQAKGWAGTGVQALRPGLRSTQVHGPHMLPSSHLVI